jgi:hypothetical protein
MSEVSFEDRLFKGFVLPGIAVGVLLILLLFVQPWVSTDILTHPIGGPAGMVIGFAMFPLVMMFVAYMLASVAYSVLLPVKYFRRSDSLVASARRFMLFSDVFLGIMDLMILSAYIEAYRWNFFGSLNLPLVVPISILIGVMTVFFISWTIAVYRYENRKFFSWKTLGGAILSLLLLQLPAIATFLCVVLFY